MRSAVEGRCYYLISLTQTCAFHKSYSTPCPSLPPASLPRPLLLCRSSVATSLLVPRSYRQCDFTSVNTVMSVESGRDCKAYYMLHWSRAVATTGGGGKGKGGICADIIVPYDADSVVDREIGNLKK